MSEQLAQSNDNPDNLPHSMIPGWKVEIGSHTFTSEEIITFAKAYLEKESQEPHGEQWQEYLLDFTPDA